MSLFQILHTTAFYGMNLHKRVRFETLYTMLLVMHWNAVYSNSLRFGRISLLQICFEYKVSYAFVLSLVNRICLFFYNSTYDDIDFVLFIEECYIVMKKTEEWDEQSTAAEICLSATLGCFHTCLI